MTAMACKTVDEKLLDLLYDEVEPAEREVLEAHIDGCARCRAEMQSFGRVRQAARTVEMVEPPQAATAKILFQAAREAPRRGGRVIPMVRKLWQHPAYAMAAGFLVIAGVAGYQLSRGTMKLEPIPMADRGVDHAAAPTAMAPTPVETAKAEVAENKRAAMRQATPTQDSPAAMGGAKSNTAVVTAERGDRGPNAKAKQKSIVADADESFDKPAEMPLPSTMAYGKAMPGTTGGLVPAPRDPLANAEAGDFKTAKKEAPPMPRKGGGIDPVFDDTARPLGEEQNQQLARSTLPPPPEERELARQAAQAERDRAGDGRAGAGQVRKAQPNAVAQKPSTPVVPPQPVVPSQQMAPKDAQPVAQTKNQQALPVLAAQTRNQAGEPEAMENYQAPPRRSTAPSAAAPAATPPVSSARGYGGIDSLREEGRALAKTNHCEEILRALRQRKGGAVSSKERLEEARCLRESNQLVEARRVLMALESEAPELRSAIATEMQQVDGEFRRMRAAPSQAGKASKRAAPRPAAADQSAY